MGKEYFFFGKALSASADSRLDNGTMRELWSGFCFRAGGLVLSRGEALSFLTEGMDAPALPEGKEFALRVTEKGIALSARDYGGLARGMMALMMRIEAEELAEGHERFKVETCFLESKYTIGVRMIHFCVFPETSPAFLKKCVRLAGVMQYTHVVLEFWGMLKYDCMKELAWENAYSKDFVRSVAAEIKDMGMEAVPMLNHLGHASACRVSGGKHVTLDQNPRLAPLFAGDGWSWNITSDAAKELLREMRRELYQLFDGSEYFHLGCDEVYSYEKGEENQRLMCRYLSELIDEVKGEGRRAIIWGDMLLNGQECGVSAPYFCGCDSPEHARQILSAIPKDTVIADWHYDVLDAPVKTSVYLKAQGFEVLGAPWYKTENCRAYARTVIDNGLMGVMVTTWHTLAEKMPHIVADALMFGAYQSPWSGPEDSRVRTETATLLRKVYFVGGDYKEAGWTDSQVFMQANAMI